MRAVAAIHHARGDGGVHGAEQECCDRGEPRVLEIGKDAERDPAQRQAEPVPAGQVDLVDDLPTATVDGVERRAGFVGGDRVFHETLTFLVGK